MRPAGHDAGLRQISRTAADAPVYFPRSAVPRRRAAGAGQRYHPATYMRRTLFITGASSYVGSAIIQALKDRFELRALSRSDSSDATIRALGATPVRGELGSVPADAIAGSEALIHCAAYVKQWGTREQFWTANVEGTRQLLQVARQAGAYRFIHIGTEAALFHGQHMRDIDERYPYPAHTPFLYSETKAAAEKLVLAANAPGFRRCRSARALCGARAIRRFFLCSKRWYAAGGSCGSTAGGRERQRRTLRTSFMASSWRSSAARAATPTSSSTTA